MSSSSSASSSTSLSLLLPSPCQRTATAATRHHRFAKTPATTELETLTRTVIDGINSRSYRTIQNLVASSYEADLDDISHSTSYDENVTRFMQMTRNPEYRVEVVDVEADVDEESGYAIVYALLSVMGRPANVRRQSVSIVEWMRKDGGGWQFYKASLMRGLDAFDIAHPGCTRCARENLRRDFGVAKVESEHDPGVAKVESAQDSRVVKVESD